MELQRKWHVELNDARESDLPGRLEPIGFCRGFVAEKVRLDLSLFVSIEGATVAMPCMRWSVCTARKVVLTHMRCCVFCRRTTMLWRRLPRTPKSSRRRFVCRLLC